MMKFNSLFSTMMSISLSILLCLGMLKLLTNLFSGVDTVLEWVVFSSSSSSISMVLIFDFMSIMFMLTVSLISLSVSVFSNSYMMAEKYFSRFMGLVLLFVTSMFLLILSPNIISILLGWDGLGVTSYLLVIFYQSPKSYNAGMITAMTNRLGDVGILLAVGLLLFKGSWSFFAYWWQMDYFLQLMMIILIVASMTKSAQIPFSAWLPAAMAAPTPVSALVHSSTLVTAGVYLMIRFNFILISLPMLKYLSLIGALTMLMAGMGAMFEMDMKKIIALSTLSQLGVMMMIIGAGFTLLGFFHLVAHAFFKAMLFICAGNLIHNFKDYQDIRLMSSSTTYLPFTMSVFMVANFSLCGLPFMAGFYSKDLILEMMLMNSLNILMLIIMVIGTALTVMYSFRFMVLLSSSGNQWEGVYTMKDNDYQIFFSMFLLLGPAILSGMLLSWFFFSSPTFIFFPLNLKLMIPGVIISSALGMEMWMSSTTLKNNFQGYSFKYLNSHMWFLPLVLSVSLTKMGLTLAKKSSIFNEHGWVEMILFSSISKSFFKLSNFFEKLFFNIFSQSIFFIFIFSFLIFENKFI